MAPTTIFVFISCTVSFPRSKSFTPISPFLFLFPLQSAQAVALVVYIVMTTWFRPFLLIWKRITWLAWMRRRQILGKPQDRIRFSPIISPSSSFKESYAIGQFGTVPDPRNTSWPGMRISHQFFSPLFRCQTPHFLLLWEWELLSTDVQSPAKWCPTAKLQNGPPLILSQITSSFLEMFSLSAIVIHRCHLLDQNRKSF